jgi:hypothetical protein
MPLNSELFKLLSNVQARYSEGAAEQGRGEKEEGRGQREEGAVQTESVPFVFQAQDRKHGRETGGQDSPQRLTLSEASD